MEGVRELKGIENKASKSCTNKHVSKTYHLSMNQSMAKMYSKPVGVPVVLKTVLYAVMIKTKLALGTGAVPIEPIVAIMISKMYDAAVTSSPLRIPSQILAHTKYTAPPSMLTVAPSGTTKRPIVSGTRPVLLTDSSVTGIVAK